jgi:hypothetical protein
LLALPSAAALGTLVFHERGEARALFALGVSPARCARTIARALLTPVLVLGLAIAFARGLGRDDALALVVRTSDVIRERCRSVSEPSAIPVPGSELTWLCARAEEPLLVGPVPGSAGQLWLSGRTLEHDGERVSIQSAQLTHRSPDGPTVNLSVDHFAVRAVSDAVTALPPLGRFAGALAGGYLAAVLLPLGLLRRDRIPRWLPLCWGLGTGSSALLVLSARSTDNGWLPVASAIAAPVLSAMLLLLIDRVVASLGQRAPARARSG